VTRQLDAVTDADLPCLPWEIPASRGRGRNPQTAASHRRSPLPPGDNHRRDRRAAHRQHLTGVLLLSSRISDELVLNAATIGAPLIVAVSAPTRLALCMADPAGITDRRRPRR